MPLRPNPFTPNAPIHDPARFAGRDTELEAIIDALYQTAQGNPHHVAITGARGIGKTSVLNMASEVAGGDRSILERLGLASENFAFNMIPVVHTANRGETIEDVTNALLLGLRRLLDMHGFETKELHWELDLKLFKVGGAAGPGVVPHVVDQLVNTLDGVARMLNQRDVNGVLLMVDEVDRITRIAPYRGASDMVEAGFGSFFKVLSEKLAARRLTRVAICLCGVAGFLQELRDEHPSIERIFRDVPIPPLTSTQADQIIVSALDTVGVASTAEARRTIVKLSGNYPEPVHLIGSEAFRVDTDDRIDEDDVDAALDRVVRYVRRNYLQSIIARAYSGRDHEILKAMASLEGPVVPVRDVGRKIGREPYQFGSNMTRLTRNEVLVRERQGMYRFREPLLGIYIDRVGLGSSDDDEPL